MKIASIAPATPYRGGIAVFGARLAQELSADHHCRYINFSRLYPSFLFPGKTQFDESAVTSSFNSERLIDSINPISRKRAGRKLRKFKADVMLFHWWHPFFAPTYNCIARSAGRDSVKIAICHNVLPHDKGGLWRMATRFGLKQMDGFAVHSLTETSELASMFPDKPVAQLFHPLYDVFPGEAMPRAEARRALGFKPTDNIMLYFGLIRPYKGVKYLLQAMPKLNDVPNLRCLVIGEIYSGREELNALVKKIPPDRVRLVDQFIPSEEVAMWFRAADVVVLPYVSATQSGIIPIAYRCNRPVIATKVGGLPEIVSEGESGFLVAPENSTELERAIRRFFVDLRKPSMKDGIAKVSKTLSWSRYRAELIDFSESLIARRGL